jgi:hypothetical protein
MVITLKIAGVPSSAIGSLHDAVRKIEYPHWVTVQESKFDPSHDDYAVTMRVDPTAKKKSGEFSTDEYVTYRSLTDLLSILRSVDHHLFPEKETDVPTPETVEKIQVARANEEIEKLRLRLVEKTTSLRGQTTRTPIMRHERAVLDPGETYSQKENEYCFLGAGISELQLPEVSDDPFVITLKEAQEILDKIDELLGKSK